MAHLLHRENLSCQRGTTSTSCHIYKLTCIHPFLFTMSSSLSPSPPQFLSSSWHFFHWHLNIFKSLLACLLHFIAKPLDSHLHFILSSCLYSFYLCCIFCKLAFRPPFREKALTNAFRALGKYNKYGVSSYVIFSLFCRFLLIHLNKNEFSKIGFLSHSKLSPPNVSSGLVAQALLRNLLEMWTLGFYHWTF